MIAWFQQLFKRGRYARGYADGVADARAVLADMRALLAQYPASASVQGALAALEEGEKTVGRACAPLLATRSRGATS